MRLMCAFLALVMLFAPVSARAESFPKLYQVSGVSVDLTVDTAVIARDAALAQAEGKAFETLVSRLSQRHEPVATPQADRLSGMVSSFEIQKEHIAGKRYIGTFSIQFNPEKVKAYLESKQVSIHEVHPVKMLLLPLTLQAGDRAVLWEDTTPWRSAWQKTPQGTGLVSLIVPEGDLQDIALASSEEIKQAAPDKMKALAEKYKTDGVLIAAYPDIVGEDAKFADVTRIDRDGKVYDKKTVKTANEKGEKLSLDDLAAALIRAVEEQMAEPPKSETLPSPDQPVASEAPKAEPAASSAVEATVQISSLAQWSDIRRKLSTIDGITSVNVVSMSRGQVRVHMDCTKPLQEIQKAMTAKGFYLALIGDGGWQIRLTNAQPE